MCWATTLFGQRYNLRTYGAETDLDPYVTGLSADSLGYLWVSTRSGRFRYDGFRFLPRADSLGPPLGTVPLVPYRDSLARWDFPQPGARPTAVLRTRNGRTWVGTREAGAFVYLPSAGQWLRLDERSGLGRDHVTALLEDRWGYVWIGTHGGGLSRYAGRQFVRYGTSEGLRQRTVHDLVRDSADGYWLAAGRAGLTYFRGDNFRHYGPAEGYPLRDTRCLLMDGDRLWIGTRGTGLFLYDSLGFHAIAPADSLEGLAITSLAKDQLGGLWVGTAGQGLLQLAAPDTSYRIPAFRRYPLPGGAVTALLIDRQARIWVGSDAGLASWTPQGLQAVPGMVGRAVRDLALGIDRTLYAATDAGLYAAPAAGGREDWVALESMENDLRSVVADSLGFVWVASPRSIFRLGGAKGGPPRRYTRAEGFPGGEVLPGAGLPEAGGALWLGTTDGLVFYRPGTDRRNRVAPRVDLRDIRLFYESLQNTTYHRWLTPSGTLAPGLVFPPGDNHLGFEFFAVNLPDPDGLRYQWRLEGAEPSWSPPTIRRDAMYPNLPPGAYTFRVRACNEEGHCGEEVRVPFAIAAPWWQRWWVALSAVLFSGLLVAALFWWRLRQIERRAEREQARLALENKLLELEGKARRLRMNPHFIFNALHTVQGLIAQGETGKARRQLTRFSQLMRAVLEQSIYEKISLADELQTLESYLAVEHTSRSESFTYALTTQLEEAAETIDLPPMLVQPFVENALQHGLAQRLNGHVGVHVEQRDDLLLITVSDNGIGRAAAARLTYKANKSRAVEITRERLRLLGALAGLTIEDLTAENGEPAGTRVVLTVPI